MVKRKRSFRYYLIKSYLFIAIFLFSLMLIIIFINTLKSTQITRQTKMNAAVELISSQVNSLVENMSFISINLISSVDVISAAKGLGYKKKYNYENARVLFNVKEGILQLCHSRFSV